MNEIKFSSPNIAPDDQLIIDEVKSKKIHLVCLALKKNYLAVNLLVKSGLFDFDRFYSYCDLVNSKSEVGCFRPLLSISLFPLHQPDRSLQVELEKLHYYFKDTLIANQEYVCASKIVYVFDRGIWDTFNLAGILQEVKSQFQKDFPQNPKYLGKKFHLQEIEFYFV